MRKVYRSLIAVFCIVVFPAVLLFAEGTKQIMPTSNSKGYLCINKYRYDFGFYDADPVYRLNISIANPSERIRYGFGKVLDANDNLSDLTYRIKDPLNNIVYGPFPVPASGQGFISSYNDACTGPVPGGYNYLEFQPLVTGDYYIEFFYPGANVDIRRYLEFFDITVVNASGNAIDGRVWSKAWHFWGGNPGITANSFYGKMMILSDDSIVTQVDCNGFQGGRFSISSNVTGCSSTGDPLVDRMSTQGFHTYPQYKVFLNDPDNTLFPTQKVASGIIAPVIVTSECTGGSADFGIKVDKDCTIKLLIQINPSPDADIEDVSLIVSAKANPVGGNGYNIIHWDGNDNLGRPVANGSALTFTVINLSGLTHLPMFDIENNDNGFIVNQIRPAGGQMKIYWDDSRVGGTTNSSTGCNGSGCRTWNTNVGDNNTINSWWFVTGSESPPVTYIAKRLPGLVTITGSAIHCIGPDTLIFSILAEPNSTSFNLSYSGSGVSIEKYGLSAKLIFSKDATPGILSVYGHNESCGDGPVSDLKIMFEPLPVVKLASFPDMCYTAPGFSLSGGKPEGGIYFVNDVKADSLYPYKLPEGSYDIVYNYTAPVGCSNSDTASILLYNSPECEGTIFFPEAFTPNSDIVNDDFRPVVENIYSFKMYIYNRWGQLVYTTEDITKGWDGTCMGEQCPEGTYTYQATYSPSLRTDESKTKKGMVTLIR
jgi:gliding motility-associated-like protein